MGGAALILAYGLNRSTEDVDLVLEDEELEVLIDEAEFGAAVEATNRELEPDGLFLTHIWGPEQQILTPDWKQSCRPVVGDWGTDILAVSALGPVDLILSKLCRADDADLDDIRYLIKTEGIERDVIEAAMARAEVPVDFADVFPKNRRRVLALFDP